jgi:cytochrome P450
MERSEKGVYVMNAPTCPASASHADWVPLDQIDVSDPRLYQEDIHYPYFERLRREDPVHYCKDSKYGPYWSVTKFKDIMTVETHPEIYSFAQKLGGITIADRPAIAPTSGFARTSGFLAMDPPRHDEERRVVSPALAPANLNNMASIIRERAGKVLDNLPRGETFDWVDRVSIELTSLMLTTLFDFPVEDRRKLTFWSDCIAMDVNAGGLIDSEEKRAEVLGELLQTFGALWRERAARPVGFDLISMLAHGEATKNLINNPLEFLGTVGLLIVGGNDTTRNTMSGGLWALNKNPHEYQKLRDNPSPSMVSSMASEMIRWQTPSIHLRCTAVADTELGGKQIRTGDKVVKWYISGNRDEDSIKNANEFIIDRPRVREHLSFGFGVHRCVGNRLAEMQLTILWEEILKRFPVIELVEEPKRVYSNTIRGISEMKVRIPA